MPLRKRWRCFVRAPEGILWLKGEGADGGQWQELSANDRASAEYLFANYERNRLAHFLPHGGGQGFVNDWKHGICLLNGPSRSGKSAHGVVFLLLRTLPCKETWPIFAEHGVEWHPYRGKRKQVISSYSWGNVEELWYEYRKWCPREYLGAYADGWGKYAGEKGSPKVLSFETGKSQRLRLTTGDELIFLSDSQKQAAWEGKRWDDHHLDEQRDREKWIGYLRGTANTRGLVQAGFTLTGHRLDDRPDTGTAGWIYTDLWLGAYTYGKTLAKYQITMDDVPDAVLAPDKKLELYKQWVEEPQKNQDEEMILKGRARYYGGWEPGGGLVVQNFEPETHIIPEMAKDHWRWKDATNFRGIDHGLSRPCAVILAKIFPWGDLLCWAEYYERGKTVPYHCRRIVEMCGNTMREGDSYQEEEFMEPVRTWVEEFTGMVFEGSVLDGRSFNCPAQERAITLGQLYNDCGLYCTPANAGHNKRPDDSTGILPNLLRYFTKQPERPHIMWQFWKRKMISDEVYEAWLKSRNGDWKNGAMLYFTRNLRWTFEELQKWELDKKTGLPIFDNDHLMSCLRYITAENPAYRGAQWRDDETAWGNDGEEEAEQSATGKEGARYVGYYR